jgi:hypothetical protein
MSSLHSENVYTTTKTKNPPDFKPVLSLSLTSLKIYRRGKKGKKERKNLSICGRIFTRSTVELAKKIKKKARRERRKRRFTRRKNLCAIVCILFARYNCAIDMQNVDL